MSIFDLFKPKWSAGKMPESDRRKIFWYLKRKSSLTAWRNVAVAFDDFASVFERQVVENPIVIPEGFTPEWATNWEMFYPQILKAQVLFEQGIERLAGGDRTVWLYNDRGVLGDAVTIAEYWYTALIRHGPHEDIYFEGQYVPEMEAAISRVSAYLFATAGVVQSMMGDAPAFEVWSQERMAFLEKQIPFPADCEEVPQPSQEISVRTGQILPCYGVYEPQVAGGCLNYLLGGTVAPVANTIDDSTDDLNSRPVTWRLIWEDKRYLDGTVPVEERTYFVAEKTVPLAVPATFDAEIYAQSHESAARAGTWAVMDDLTAKVQLAAGELLPQNNGRDVTWVWVSR